MNILNKEKEFTYIFKKIYVNIMYNRVYISHKITFNFLKSHIF